MSIEASLLRFAEGESGHIEYIIKVFYLGRQWVIRKRYSEFDHFDATLRAEGFSIPYSLPPKLSWLQTNETTLKIRARELHIYLNKLLEAIPADNSLVCEFLDVEPNMLQLALKKNPSFKHIRQTDRVRNIIQRASLRFIDIDLSIRHRVALIDGSQKSKRSMSILSNDSIPSVNSQGVGSSSYSSSYMGSHMSKGRSMDINSTKSKSFTSKSFNGLSTNMLEAARQALAVNEVRDRFVRRAEKIATMKQQPTRQLEVAENSSSVEEHSPERISAILGAAVSSRGISVADRIAILCKEHVTQPKYLNSKNLSKKLTAVDTKVYTTPPPSPKPKLAPALLPSSRSSPAPKPPTSEPSPLRLRPSHADLPESQRYASNRSGGSGF